MKCTQCRHCGPKTGADTIRCDHPSYEAEEPDDDMRSIAVTFAPACADFEKADGASETPPSETPASETPATGLRNSVLEPAMAWFFRAGVVYGRGQAVEHAAAAAMDQVPTGAWGPMLRVQMVKRVEALEELIWAAEVTRGWEEEGRLNAEEMVEWALDEDPERRAVAREYLVRCAGLRQMQVQALAEAKEAERVAEAQPGERRRRKAIDVRMGIISQGSKAGCAEPTRFAEGRENMEARKWGCGVVHGD